MAVEAVRRVGVVALAMAGALACPDRSNDDKDDKSTAAATEDGGVTGTTGASAPGQCGPERCDLDELCNVSFTDGQPEYRCNSLPGDCLAVPDPSCDCVDLFEGCTCVEEPEDHMTVTCVPP